MCEREGGWGGETCIIMYEYTYYLIIGAYPVAAYTSKVLFLQEPVELHSKERLTMILLQYHSQIQEGQLAISCYPVSYLYVVGKFVGHLCFHILYMYCLVELSPGRPNAVLVLIEAHHVRAPSKWQWYRVVSVQRACVETTTYHTRTRT